MGTLPRVRLTVCKSIQCESRHAGKHVKSNAQPQATGCSTAQTGVRVLAGLRVDITPPEHD